MPQTAVRELGHDVLDLLQHVYSSCFLLCDAEDEMTKTVIGNLLTKARASKEKITGLLQELNPMKIQSLSILIVEDDEQTRQFLKKTVESVGHKVVAEASDGQQMIHAALDETVQLVIFDIHLPKIDGFDALKHINKRRILPAVVVTGDSDMLLAHQAQQEHILGYLIKPIEPPALLVAISVAYERFKEIEALRQENDKLEETLERRKLMERAKGILMTRYRWDEGTAFRWLQKTAMNLRRPLVDLCNDVINGKATA